MILFYLDAAPASFCFLKAGVVTWGKNLKDRRCWFIVGWLMFLQVLFWILALFFASFFFGQEVFCVFFFFRHCGCFCSLVDVRGGRATAARPVKGPRSPHFLVVWRDPSFASKWKLCLKLSEEIHFIGAVGYNYCITTQKKFKIWGVGVCYQLARAPPTPQGRKAFQAFLVLDVQSC